MSWRLVTCLAAALLVPLPAAVASRLADERVLAAPREAPPPAEVSVRESTPRIAPRETWSSARDARALASDDLFVWVATGGGLDRYTRANRDRRHYGAEDGLDSLDVRAVERTRAGISVRTATGDCIRPDWLDRFACTRATASAARAANLELFRGHPVTALLVVDGDGYIATRGGGAFFAPGGDTARAVTLGSDAVGPTSFVHTGVAFSGAMWLGTFDDGLYRVPLDREGRLVGSLGSAARPVASPARMVNRLAATHGRGGALFVGASNGLFMTRDGEQFSPVTTIAPRAITGLAVTKRHLWVATTEALYRLAETGTGRVQRAFVYPGGSHAIQAIAVDDSDVAWLATEDRGIVRLEADADSGPASVRTFDRLAGLPTSWFVAVDTDGAGGVIAASLRHGSVHIARDTSWSPLAWGPSPWGLGVHHDGARTCIGTQNGARCETNGALIALGALPDPRVHVFIPLGSDTLVGTEAGVAVYALPGPTSGS